jgi:hypothetical protein
MCTMHGHMNIKYGNLSYVTCITTQERRVTLSAAQVNRAIGRMEEFV